MDSIYAQVQSANTTLGIINGLNTILGKVNIDLDLTLNKKYSVLDEEEPTSPVIIQYFGVGVRGVMDYELDEDGLLVNTTTPYRPSGDNMDLYTPIPILVHPIADDIGFDSSDYRLRTIISVGSEQYVAYWLKKINVTDENIGKLYTVTKSDATRATYVPTPNFYPEPIEQSLGLGNYEKFVEASSIGICRLTSEELQSALTYLTGASAETPLTIAGVEHTENLFSHIRISEIGFYSGIDKINVETTFTVDDIEHTKTYTEAIGIQLAVHRCMTALDMSQGNIIREIPFELTNGSCVVSGTQQ